jgi:hypothetical protein
MKPWIPSFDPVTNSLSRAPVWVRPPNLPLYLLGLPSLRAIKNSLGKFHQRCEQTKNYSNTTYARICVEMDFSKGFLAEIILIGESSSWSQKLDYENVYFHCKVCFEIGHKETHWKNILKGPKP